MRSTRLRRRLLLGLVPAVPLMVALPLACGAPPAARIGLVMRAPQGLLDAATSVELWVFPADQARCGANGHVDRIPEGGGTQQFSLKSAGCPDGVRWCQDIELDQDGEERMFAVIARNAGGTLAEGCAVAAIDQDPLEVSIKVQRYNPPSCCGDGVLQAGEQCDLGEAPTACSGEPGGRCLGTFADEVCACDCTASELLLAIDNQGEPQILAGPPGSKSQLALAFTPGVGAAANALRAVYRDTDTTNTKGGSDINIRFLSDQLYAIADPVPLSRQLRMPLPCSALAGDGDAGEQEAPAITAIGSDQTGIVYASDQGSPGIKNAWLVVHSAYGCKEGCAMGDAACEARSTPVQLSAAGSSDITDPDVAGGPPDAALAVWTRDGRVLGRIRRTDGSLAPPAGELEIAPSGARPRVAGTAAGWVVVYEGGGPNDPSGVLLRRVGADGAVQPEVLVNSRTEGLQEQPDVAQMPDGRTIVVWRGDSDIYFQRFDAALTPLPRDQDAPLNTTTDGEQRAPAVAAGGALGAFYAVAWEHEPTGGIQARFPGADGGFFFNSVTGQNDDSPASHPGVAGQRRLPAISVGGAGFVAVGWQDDSPARPGVFARRLPLPAAQ